MSGRFPGDRAANHGGIGWVEPAANPPLPGSGWERIHAARADIATLGGACVEDGCDFVGPRKICDDCATGIVLNPRAQARCHAHHVEHRHAVHGEAPKPVVCTGCRKPLGTSAKLSSRAGAPWCGDCPPWWHF